MSDEIDGEMLSLGLRLRLPEQMQEWQDPQFKASNVCVMSEDQMNKNILEGNVKMHDLVLVITNLQDQITKLAKRVDEIELSINKRTWY